ncbi:DUF2800 domain-containing protein [Pseudomonas sp. PDM21]|uniref:DUF2800 domain-containing protein n=1 Tax=Pseudomonas sp. PDM21 TaxID=2769257 RepID=UPI001783AC39|nr:DUF2800 domain-containing protein [Pseudomonas sp. PDM21]MBD9674937.1 DUF2800 domain-containing protein [Pseudomonas sp. PDM21]
MSAAAPEAHSALGGSVIALIEICPGSLAMSRGMPNTAGRHAREGSCAHRLAELCLLGNLDPVDFLGETLEGFEEFTIEHEMVEHVTAYVDFCHSQTEPDDVVLIETRFDLEELGPEAEEMFGSADFVRYRPRTGHLLLADLKYGQGVPVEVRTHDGKPNRQVMYYGVGAVIALRKRGFRVKGATLVIAQPRAPHQDGPFRSVDVTNFDILEWIGDLLKIARRAHEPHPQLCAGPHCKEKFCKGLPRCPAHERWVMQQGALVEENGSIRPSVMDPRLLSHAELSAVLAAAPSITGWVNACQEYAHRVLEAGEPFDGWKLVAKRADRRWNVDESRVVAFAEGAGVARDELFKRSLLSPAQVEKLLPKDQREGLAELVKKESSGTTLAPEADKRPAVACGPGADFDELPES